MTDARLDYWRTLVAGAYQQQDVIDTPTAQTPNNARHAVRRFTKRHTLRRFENPIGWGSDGRGRRGEPTFYDFYANVQPLSIKSNELEQLPEAARSKAAVYVTYDPYYEPDSRNALYPNGFFVWCAGFNFVYASAYQNSTKVFHSDLIEYDGVLWECVWADCHNGGEEERYIDGRICDAIFVMFEDKNHEVQSGKNERVIFDGNF